MLLAIDTATRYASLALHDGGAVRAEMTWEISDRHTVELMPRLAWMLEQVGLRAGALTGLAVSIGPGSFTGLRVGLAIAKGLALANSLPVVGIPTLDVVAYAQTVHKGPLVAVLQAGRSKLAARRYRRARGAWRAQGEVMVTTVDRIGAEWTAPTWLCGELSAAEREAIGARLGARVILVEPARSLRRAGFLAELGWQRLRTGDADDLDALKPIYIPTAGVAVT
ncbi:MAG TPA: tRNA (adenosine(37)-N6)-threonylcarbamoyltransferase complex dimerization subunit type 1 TsaB [Anaerolineae bacterium]|nr:tRNA (adenosine(37)-N6)-threonylcarbamoyltransferase complex dimerization subunit type 1 TsaB [Anaerolineae bacterium]